MFTGIITAIGEIETVTSLGEQHGIRLLINAGTLDLTDVVLGDSIAIQGACMTVVARSSTHFEVEVSRESLRLTQGLAQTGPVNLEKALRLADRIGGHLVSGHIDGLGVVSEFTEIGESTTLRIQAAKSLAPYLAYKGSITVNGVSLTVNHVDDLADACEFSINLIPHTVLNTTLQHLHINDAVNLEIDLIARYCQRMLSLR